MKLYAITQNLNKDGLALKSEGVGGVYKLYITLNRKNKSVYYIAFTEEEFILRNSEGLVIFHEKANKQKGKQDIICERCGLPHDITDCDLK